MGFADRPLRLLSGLLLAVSLAGLYAGPGLLEATADVGGPAGHPRVCSFRLRTGLPCVGCGGTHALALMARGDLRGALARNPLGAWAGLAAWLLALASGLSLVAGSRRILVGALALVTLLTPVVFMACVVSWWAALPPGTPL